MGQKRLYSITLLLISAACQAMEPVTQEFSQPSYQECFIEFQKSLKVEKIGLELEAEHPALYQEGQKNDTKYTTHIRINGHYPQPEVWIVPKEPEKEDTPKEEILSEKTRRVCKTIYGLHY